MKRDLGFYLKLFYSTFSLSAFTFGGGYVIVPLMRKKFVMELGWLEEKEMLDLTAIAQSAPGAMAVNAAILVGYRLAGLLGAIVTILGTVLPPLIILSVISLFYISFRESTIVSALLVGMQAAIGAVIVDVVWSMSSNLVKDNGRWMLAIVLFIFIASYVFNISLILIILSCALAGAGLTYKNKKKTDDEVNV